MFEVHEEAALRHPKPFLYGILADVQRVPDYLPSCTSMSLIEDSDTLLRFRCTVRGLGTLEIETLFEKNLLTMNLVSGLPVRIQARWRIQSLDGGSSRVFFDAEADIPAGMRFWARRRALETALKGALTQLQKRADALA